MVHVTLGINDWIRVTRLISIENERIETEAELHGNLDDDAVYKEMLANLNITAKILTDMSTNNNGIEAIVELSILEVKVLAHLLNGVLSLCNDSGDSVIMEIAHIANTFGAAIVNYYEPM